MPIPPRSFIRSAADGGTAPTSPKMINSIRILCWVTIFSLVALGMGPFGTNVSARGRSFPIEVTGTIISVDRANYEFRLRVDEPARVLVIGLRRDRKFFRNGTPAKIDILKKGAYVKVSYFATIFTGNLAVEIEANPKAESVHGVIEKIEPTKRLLTLRLNDSRSFLVRWAANLCPVNRGRVIAPTNLKEGMIVDVSYYSPAFEKKYAVKIERESHP
jgi:hypothetical protein